MWLFSDKTYLCLPLKSELCLCRAALTVVMKTAQMDANIFDIQVTPMNGKILLVNIVQGACCLT